MKAFTLKSLIAAALFAAASGTACAQRVITNTVTPKDLTVYNEQTVDLSIFRYIYKGWNTICLPISLNEAEIDEIFGADCRLETLVGVENNGTETKLDFKDVKRDGLKALTPYILYSEKENGVREIRQTESYITTGPVELTFTDHTGTTVTFGGATEASSAEGIYGILVKDNTSAAFVNCSNVANGIRASRCFIRMNDGETTNTLTSNHLEYDEVTNINDATSQLTDGELVDVFNVSGVKIANQIPASQIKNLGSGVYVIKGKVIQIP